MPPKRSSRGQPSLFPAKKAEVPAIFAEEALSFLRETRGVTTWTARDMAEALKITVGDAKRVNGLKLTDRVSQICFHGRPSVFWIALGLARRRSKRDPSTASRAARTPREREKARDSAQDDVCRFRLAGRRVSCCARCKAISRPSEDQL